MKLYEQKRAIERLIKKEETRIKICKARIASMKDRKARIKNVYDHKIGQIDALTKANRNAIRRHERRVAQLAKELEALEATPPVEETPEAEPELVACPRCGAAFSAAHIEGHLADCRKKRGRGGK